MLNNTLTLISNHEVRYQKQKHLGVLKFQELLPLVICRSALHSNLITFRTIYCQILFFVWRDFVTDKLVSFAKNLRRSGKKLIALVQKVS